jgi:hypothetical protein
MGLLSVMEGILEAYRLVLGIIEIIAINLVLLLAITSAVRLFLNN